jgi:phosphate transport system permease protein
MNANPLQGAMVSLPLETLKLVQADVPAYTTRAFGCAAFLLLVIVVLFVIARKIGGWGPGHLTPRGQRRVAAASLRDVDRFARRSRIDASGVRPPRSVGGRGMTSS